MKSDILLNTKDKPLQAKVRDSNLELFRIIAMILIVAHHFVVNSGLTASDGPVYSSPLSFNSLFLLVFGAWGKIGINCFVMITGYFMCKSQITLIKFFRLLFEIQFYRILIFLIFFITGYSSFSFRTFVIALLPVYQISLNFTGCFLVFWLFIPFLNILISHLNEKQHFRLILLCVFLYVILGTVKSVTMNYVSWFIVLYIISSYIRFYPKKSFSNTKLWGWLTFFSVFVSAISVVVGTWLVVKINKNLTYFFVTDSNTILALAVGLCAFMFFKNIDIKYNRVINTIASSTFGVLLIHANSDTMRQWLWKDILDVVGHYQYSLMPLYALGSVLAIFIVCVSIDIIRINLIEKPFFKWFDRHKDGFISYIKKIESWVYKKLNIE